MAEENQDQDREGKMHVRLKPGVRMVINGEPKNAGDDCYITEDQARAGAQYFEQINEKGEAKPLQLPGQPGGGDVAAANVAGLPRHERIEALEGEEKGLQSRLDRVRKNLEHERAGMQDDIKRQKAGGDGGDQGDQPAGQGQGQAGEVKIDPEGTGAAGGGVSAGPAKPAKPQKGGSE